MRPHVVAHLAVTPEGATTGFAPDLGRFYGLAATWREDVTLVGADTILSQEPALAASRRPGPAADGPLLAVVDSRRRVRAWDALRVAGHWRDVVAVRAEPSPAPVVAELVAGGTGAADLAAALGLLAQQHGARTVRVDSGGALVGALLAGGLLDEVSLLVHPVLAGPAGERRWYGVQPPPAGALTLLGSERFPDGTVWLRYAVSP